MSFTPTEEQNAIIPASTSARLLVEAGPGTGKTEVVARRLAHLLGTGTLRPSEVLVLSFSRSAVKALISRIRKVGEQSADAVDELRHLSVRTFDSWTFRALRFLGCEPTDLLQDGYEANIERLLESLRCPDTQSKLRDEGVKLGRIRHLVVDEVQDLTGARAELVLTLMEVLCPPGSNHAGFTLLGDFHQAIYGFSAKRASGKQITSQEFLKSVRGRWANNLQIRPLTKNHRSRGGTAAVVQEATAILEESEAKGADPVPALKQLLSDLPQLDATGLLDDIAPVGRDATVAVLCRERSQIAGLAADLETVAFKNNREIPGVRLMIGTPPRVLPSWVGKLLYQFVGKDLTRSVFDRVFRIVFPPEAVVVGRPVDEDAAWRLLLRFARRSDNDTSIAMDELRRRIGWPDSLPDDEGETDSRLVMTTIHQSKGLEFDIVRVMSGGEYEREDTDADEEGRVLFVGISRAREGLSSLKTDSDCFFRELECRDNRRRWYRMLPRPSFARQLEIGCDGDIDTTSLVRSDLMANDDEVKRVQEILASRENELVGRKVVLSKQAANTPGKLHFIYRIEVQDGPHEGLCLGFSRNQLTYDLLSLISQGKVKNLTLPGKIYNLRIGAITTVAIAGELPATVPAPWRVSQLWLAPVIHGIATFKTSFRKT